MREKKQADRVFTKYVPGASDGKAALEVLDKMSGERSSHLLLGNKNGVTERDKVSFNLDSVRYILQINNNIPVYITVSYITNIFTGNSYLWMLNNVAWKCRRNDGIP